MKTGNGDNQNFLRVKNNKTTSKSAAGEKNVHARSRRYFYMSFKKESVLNLRTSQSGVLKDRSQCPAAFANPSESSKKPLNKGGRRSTCGVDHTAFLFNRSCRRDFDLETVDFVCDHHQHAE